MSERRTLRAEDVTPDNVEHFEQNKPSLIVSDLAAYGVPADAAYSILMARGVFKWLAVRRDLIALKNVWRGDITRLLGSIRDAKRDGDRDRLNRLRGELAAVNRCRQQVRALCHSPRWRAPAFDGRASMWAHSRGPLRDLPGALRRLIRRKRELPEPQVSAEVAS